MAEGHRLEPQERRDIVVVGASAGGVEALSSLVKGLPKDFPAAVFMVLHIPARGPSVLPDILNRAGTLPVRHPEDEEPIRHGYVYVAPPDRHLLLQGGKIRVVRGPSENGHRPAVDPLFRSAARYYGRRAIGVILTGTLDDGTAGLLLLKSLGGTAIVQDPAEALFAGMPQSAVDNVPGIDYILPLPLIASTLEQLVREPLPPLTKRDINTANRSIALVREADKELEIVGMDADLIEEEARPGDPSPFSCPECGGVLMELQEGTMVRYRCRTGHAYSPDSLFSEQDSALEAALWAAFRALEESAMLANRLAERSTQRGHKRAAVIFKERAQEANERAHIVRQALLRGSSGNAATEAEEVAAGKTPPRLPAG